MASVPSISREHYPSLSVRINAAKSRAVRLEAAREDAARLALLILSAMSR